MKNNKLFQYIVIGLFIFFIIFGVIMFATYKSSTTTTTNINITMWGTLPADDFSSFISKYLNNASLKYNVSYVARDPATFDRDLVEALASGVGPDAIILPQDMIIRYRNKIYPIPYTSLPELNFKQTYIQEGELYLSNEGVLALPFSVDPLVMYWNRDVFNNNSVTKPPVNWTDISALIPKMTKVDQSKNIFMSTVALGEYRNVTNAKNILSAILIQSTEEARALSRAAFGNPIVNMNSDGSLSSTLNEEFNQKSTPASLALEFYTNFSNPVKSDYSWNRSLDNSLNVFANGDLAIYFGFASEYTKIKNKNPNLNFGVAILPQITGAKVNSTFGNMLGFAIMKNSKDLAGTYTVLNTITSAEAVPFWKEYFNVPSARRDVLAQIENDAVKKVFNISAIMSKGWLDPSSIETNKIFQEMVESYTTGREGIEEAVNIASDMLDNLLITN